MEFAEIKSFLVIADLGSFSRASHRLGIPQPTLSRQINRLEAELGGPLLYRNGRGTTLTESGTRFRAAVDPLVKNLDNLRDEIVATANVPAGTVRLGIPPSFGRSIAAAVITQFRKQCPSARLIVVEAFSGTLAEWLESGHINTAVLYDVRRSSQLIVSPLLREDLFLLSSNKIGASEESIAMHDIVTNRLVLPSKAQGLRRAIETAFEDNRIVLDYAVEVDSIAATKGLVEDSDLEAILPFGAIHREVRAGRLRARRIVSPLEFSAVLVFATARSQPVSSATPALQNIINAEIARCLASGVLRGRRVTERRSAQRSDEGQVRPGSSTVFFQAA